MSSHALRLTSSTSRTSQLAEQAGTQHPHPTLQISSLLLLSLLCRQNFSLLVRTANHVIRSYANGTPCRSFGGQRAQLIHDKRCSQGPVGGEPELEERSVCLLWFLGWKRSCVHGESPPWQMSRSTSQPVPETARAVLAFAAV